MGQRRVVVIGAGIGGLATALRLAAAGVATTVVEAATTPGGKMRESVVDGAPIDVGPTVFTMRWVFEELARDCGVSLDDHLVSRKCETLARHAWDNGARLDLFADVERSVAVIGDFAGARDAEGYRRFSQRAAEIYSTLKDSFITASRPNPMSLVSRVGISGIGGLARISPFATLWSELGAYFQDPRLLQLFGRYATYCGSSPFDAPATLMLVAHVERDGVWLIDGGMRRLADTIARLAQARGAVFHYDQRVKRILVEHGRAAGVELADGERLPADAVVMNGEVSALADGMLGPDVVGAIQATPRAGRSLSAMTWAISAPTRGFSMLRHNVFFSSNYRGEFDEIRRGSFPRTPTVYVCAQDRDDRGDRSSGDGQRERLFCLVNAPPNGDGDHLQRADVESCEEAMFRHLDRCGLQISRRTEATIRTTPMDFARLFPASGGALYGRASHGWMASFARPGSRTRLPGLYLAGGGTHPGPGVPMAALSGRQAALSVMTDLNSTGRLIPAAMPGGMSTRSATMDVSGSPSSPSLAASSHHTTPGPADPIRSTTAR